MQSSGDILVSCKVLKDDSLRYVWETVQRYEPRDTQLPADVLVSVEPVGFDPDGYS